MKVSDILEYSLKKNGAYADYPFGEIPVCVKVHKRIFAQVYPDPDGGRVTLKCEPMAADFYRQKYPDTVTRGYHCPPVQQPYWNTIRLNGAVPEEELKRMVDEAYSCVIRKLPKKEREHITGL